MAHLSGQSIPIQDLQGFDLPLSKFIEHLITDNCLWKRSQVKGKRGTNGLFYKNETKMEQEDYLNAAISRSKTQ